MNQQLRRLVLADARVSRQEPWRREYVVRNRDIPIERTRGQWLWASLALFVLIVCWDYAGRMDEGILGRTGPARNRVLLDTSGIETSNNVISAPIQSSVPRLKMLIHSKEKSCQTDC